MADPSLDIPVGKSGRRRTGLWVGGSIAIIGLAAALYWAGWYPTFRSTDLSRAGDNGLFRPVASALLVQKTKADPPPSFASDSDPADLSQPDSFIEYIIKARLERNRIPVANLNIRVERGHVLLKGSVSTAERRDRAELLVRQTDRIRGVTNRLRVQTRAATKN